MERLHAVARGGVQGVGFRAYVRRYARTLGVTGFAQNLPDGAVEVVAEGSRDALNHLLAVVRRGSPSGWVESVTEQWTQATEEFTAFTIR